MRSALLGIGCLVAASVIPGQVYAQSGAPAAARDSFGLVAHSADGLTIRADTLRREIDPGAAITLRMIVENGDRAERNLSLRTIVPTGWRLLSAPSDTRIAAGARIVRLVQIASPADAAAGEYRIVHVPGAPGLDEDLRVQATVIVRARRSLSMLVDEPFFAAGGSTYRATFLVTNHGNVVTRVHLHARSERELTATVDTLTELAPGESRQVGVVVNTENAPGAEALRHHVTLIAEAEGGLSGDDPAASKAMASVRVVPRSDNASQPWYSLPLNLSLSSQSQQLQSFTGTTSQSFELSGSGPLTEGGASTLDVFARGPQPTTSLFAERDEYHIGILNPHFALQLGDQIFTQTAMSQMGSIASGLSGRFSLGRWTAGASAGRDRWMPDAPVERAGFLGLDATSRLHLSANFLDGGQFGAGTLGTADMVFRPSALSMVEVERGSRLDGARAFGTLVRASGQQGKLTFDVRHQQADSAYLSSLRGARQDWLSFTYRASDRLRIVGRIDDRASAGLPVVDGIFFQPLTRTARAVDLGGDYGNLFAVGIRSYEGQDGMLLHAGELPPVGERAGWARFNLRLHSVTLTAAAERGVSDAATGGPTRAFASTSLKAAVLASRHASFSLFVDHATGLRRYETESEHVVTLGGSADFRLGAFHMSATGAGTPSFLGRPTPDSLQAGLGWFDGTMAYDFAPGRTLAFRVRTVTAGFGLPSRSTARVSYSLPLNMPVGRSRSSGRVVGRVYDTETGMGIPNALVRLGERSALTDDDGRVAFGSVLPDRYPVYVDLGARQTAGIGFQNQAMQVSSRAGYTSEMALGVVRLGQLRGRLQLYEVVNGPRAPGDSLREQRVGGLGGILVSLVNGTEERRVMSDSGGWFELRDARPGEWRIIVPTSQLPPLHYVDVDSIRVVDVPVGGSAVVEIKVRPRQRRILPLDAPPSAPAVAPAAAAPAPAPVSVPSSHEKRARGTKESQAPAPSLRPVSLESDAGTKQPVSAVAVTRKVSAHRLTGRLAGKPLVKGRRAARAAIAKTATPLRIANLASAWEIGLATARRNANLANRANALRGRSFARFAQLAFAVQEARSDSVRSHVE